ncbi:hypothetical protein OF83DRAFT_853230 [Amylostereum chailletii]|nr:hypothetical protein OF83DRAFT_853230 [Amylostereum chailletii]
MSGSMMSKVGNPQVYNDGDQRPSHADVDAARQQPAYEAGQRHSHQDTDAKDERTIANRLAAAEKKDHEPEPSNTVTDPLAPARSHGNEPSRGAKIDAEIQREEEELLGKKNA